MYFKAVAACIRDLSIAAALVTLSVVAILLYLDLRDPLQLAILQSADTMKSVQTTSDRASTSLNNLDTVLRDTQTSLTMEVHQTSLRLDQRLGSVQADLDGQLAKLQESADTNLGKATDVLEKTRLDLQGVTDEAKGLLASSNKAVVLLTPQALGMVAASKVTAGETAQTMKVIRDAMPQIVSNVDKLVENSNKTTESTSEVMNNFARATKPLPKWARLGFAIAPPLAQIAVAVATVLAITGVL